MCHSSLLRRHGRRRHEACDEEIEGRSQQGDSNNAGAEESGGAERLRARRAGAGSGAWQRGGAGEGGLLRLCAWELGIAAAAEALGSGGGQRRRRQAREGSGGGAPAC